MDILNFLDGETPDDAPTPAPEPQAAPDQAPAPEQVETGPARGPDGKFVAQADPAPQAAPPQPEPAPQPAPAAQTPEPAHAPLTALLDEREKRQNAERELAELRKQVAPPPPAAPAPDYYEDPAGYTDQRTLNIRLDLSEDMARGKHGEETVTAAQQWALARMQASPAFNAEVLSNRNPYEFVVQAYQRDQVVSQLTPDTLAAFKSWQVAQAALQSQQPAASAAPPTPVAPPPVSLASATSAGGMQHVPSGPGQAFDAVIK